MSAKVNLLPPEIAQRRRQRRTARLTALGVVVWMALLGGLFVYKTGEVAEAELARDAAQAEVATLQTQVAALGEFQQLALQLDARSQLLAAAMTDEISWARVLNDLSLAFPGDASMTTLTASLTPPAEAAPGEIVLDTSLGDLAFTGYSVDELAPGVEGVLIEFANARGFVNTYLNTATESELGSTEVTDFNGLVQLDEAARTGRYDDGLPTEDTQ